MTPDLLKCAYCAFSVQRWTRRKGKQAKSGAARLKNHVEREHLAEFVQAKQREGLRVDPDEAEYARLEESAALKAHREARKERSA